MTTARRDGSAESASVPAYVLAGGRSRRFGTDKARAVVGGVPMIVVVARMLGAATTGLTVVARRHGAYDDLGLRTIGDVVESRGPLGGLLSAMEDMPRPGWLLLSSCDWLGLRSEWLNRLVNARTQNDEIVAFRGLRVEPLLALYHTRLAPRVRERVGREDRSLQSLIASARTRFLEAPRDWDSLVNVNRTRDVPAHGK